MQKNNEVDMIRRHLFEATKEKWNPMELVIDSYFSQYIKCISLKSAE
jgi:hypothetical protein